VEHRLTPVNILGVDIHCLRIGDIFRLVGDWIAGGGRRTILYANAHCLNVADRDPGFCAILNQADLIYADGISVVWAAWLLSGCRTEKATGADWIHDFCRLASEKGWRIYILGGRAGVAVTAESKLVALYPGLQVAGVADGFFEVKSEAEVLRDLERLKPDVLFVGMGTPRQEQWIAEQRASLPVPICWAVGALFDYIAGHERRAPRWLVAVGLEWAWRLLMDPAGKWRRYIIGNPRFVYRVLRQKWSSIGDRAVE
jgi:N-acetylglucosaminyldiphosphoundecaprenol N-acetyl-beta-D-mannosaminyltransferase